MKVCPSCMRYENLLEKQRKEIARLKSQLKAITDKIYQRVCNLGQPKSEYAAGQAAISNSLPINYFGQRKKK